VAVRERHYGLHDLELIRKILDHSSHFVNFRLMLAVDLENFCIQLTNFRLMLDFELVDFRLVLDLELVDFRLVIDLELVDFRLVIDLELAHFRLEFANLLLVTDLLIGNRVNLFPLVPGVVAHRDDVALLVFDLGLAVRQLLGV
jgi:hypothetical protein